MAAWYGVFSDCASTKQWKTLSKPETTGNTDGALALQKNWIQKGSVKLIRSTCGQFSTQKEVFNLYVLPVVTLNFQIIGTPPSLIPN
jgi:hypothetical protein